MSDMTINEVKERVLAGETVIVRGFGSFKPVKRAAKVCRNVHTGEAMTVPERMGVRFRPSKKLVADLS